MEVESLQDIVVTVALSRECQFREAQLQAVNSDISKLELEMMKLNLEKQWCFDGEGHRIVATVEETAMSVCQELVSYPHCVEDTVKALRMKRIDLQCRLKDVELRCAQLKEEMRRL
ncbi:hypothetical protein BsWGS_29221 [Bradybaena similaris]